ncbi:MAG: LysR family transcriptional regulator [Lacrimispora sp.]|uniref:LysR family transcriptional regulator n=1 Tax=Lacrimispora sp. TaxID=2719234 RepID=UPI0039E57066
MDTKQIEYILAIAEENNITRAAEKLFITQPALNQQLLRLEKELGTPLFYRSRTNWRLTPAGEIYIANAKEMLQMKKDTYAMISDLLKQKKGYLSIAFPPGRGSDMFIHVYPVFHAEYPEITVIPFELSVRKQMAAIASGEVDIGFQTLCRDQMPDSYYIPICSEEMLLSIPSGHPLASGACEGLNKAITLDISSVQYEPFVLIYKESTNRALIDRIFEEAGVKPNILFETSRYNTITRMIQARLCCGILPEYYAKACSDGISSFSLPGHPSWETVAAYKGGSYLSRAARRFIDLASQYWNS